MLGEDYCLFGPSLGFYCSSGLRETELLSTLSTSSSATEPYHLAVASPVVEFLALPIAEALLLPIDIGLYIILIAVLA